MSNLKAKLGHIIPGLVAVSLPLMTGITIDGGSVALESDELSSIGTALTSGGGSLLNVGIQLLPIIISFTVILIVYGLIKRFGRLKTGGKSGGLSNNKRIYNEMYDYVSEPDNLGYMSGNKIKQSDYAYDEYTALDSKRDKHYFRKAFNNKYGYDFIGYRKRYYSKYSK